MFVGALSEADVIEIDSPIGGKDKVGELSGAVGEAVGVGVEVGVAKVGVGRVITIAVGSGSEEFF